MSSSKHLHKRTKKDGVERASELKSNINVKECPGLLPKVIEFTEMLKKHKKIAEDYRKKFRLCEREKNEILKTIHLLRVESIATALHEEFLISREVTIKVQDLTNELKKIQNMDRANRKFRKKEIFI